MFLQMQGILLKRKMQGGAYSTPVLWVINFFHRKFIKNGCGCWYTCLLYPGMEPTNNLAEQAIREHVIMRKIIGCFRSVKGAENYQYIASLLATARLQGKNGFAE